jgi:hypothetical protein
MLSVRGTLVGAGLGDIIRVIYHGSSYRFLSETEIPVAVLVASHNPFAVEIFRHHRNAKNFLIVELGHKYVEFFRSGMRGVEINKALVEFAGLREENLIRGRVEPGYVPIFDR